MKKRILSHNQRMVLIYIFPILMIIVSLFVGRYPIDTRSVWYILKYPIFGGNVTPDAVMTSIIYDIRLPRTIFGLLVGGSLAVSGATLQGMFRNPLVDSGMLGVSAGASFGAILAIILFNNNYMMIISLSFIFGLIAVLMSYFIGNFKNLTSPVLLVLGGVIVSSFFSSLVSFGKFIADPFDELPAIVFWLMGSLANIQYKEILLVSIPMLIGVIGIFLMRWKINILSMGDKEALSMGINPKTTRIVLISFCTLATASAVCFAGTIGWIGLIIPHIIRMLIGNDNRRLIPASFFLGGSFLIFIDCLARSLSSAEIPITILTSLIGAPFYVLLIRKTKGGGW